MDSSRGAGSLGRVCSCLSHCGATKTLGSLDQLKKDVQVVQLLGHLTPIFPMVWEAKCYS